MKKFLIFPIMCMFFLMSVEAINMNNYSCFIDIPVKLNTSNFIEYTKKIDKDVVKLCSDDFCSHIKSKNMAKALDIFAKEYYSYLKENTDEETAISIYLKGFRINLITIDYCK